MKTASQVGLLIGLGVMAALVISWFIGSNAPSSSSAMRGPGALFGRDRAAVPPVPTVDLSSSATETDPLLAAAPNGASVATTTLSIVQSNTVEAAVRTAPAALPANNQDQPTVEHAAAEDELVERPLGWCFQMWSGPPGPWLAVSPPGEPTHELRSESRVVWNGSRSAWLGSEDQRGGGAFRIDIMWQPIDAIPYRGSRIELSVQSRGTTGWLHLFLRTQRAAENELALLGSPPQNYLFSQYSGDSWERLAVVADVPADADVIVLGVGVWWRGHAWIDDARLTKVATSTRLTNNPLGADSEAFTMPLGHVRPFDAPTNLDFEATAADSADLSLQRAGC